MTDIESLKFQLEAEKHAYTRNAEELIRQRDEARSDLANMLRSAEITIATLTKERDEARDQARGWEYRSGDWMIRYEDAEAEAERLKKQNDALRAQVETLRKTIDTAGHMLSFSDAGTVQTLLARALSTPAAEPVSPAYNFGANPEWIPKAASAEAQRDHLIRRLEDALERQGEDRDEALSALADALRSARFTHEVAEMMPAAHAEKVIVAVAKAAAQVGAEGMKERVLKMLRASAQAYGSASTSLRDYARDATNAYVERIEGMLP